MESSKNIIKGYMERLSSRTSLIFSWRTARQNSVTAFSFLISLREFQGKRSINPMEALNPCLVDIYSLVDNSLNGQAMKCLSWPSPKSILVQDGNKLFRK